MQDRTLYLKRGRPTRYTKETPKLVISYIKKCQEKEEFLTIEHLSSYLGAGTRVLYEWEKEYSEFMQTMDVLRDQLLLYKSLKSSL